MNLIGAEKTVQKLLTCVQSVADSDSALYDKSKQRLRRISDTCVQIIEVLSGILQMDTPYFKSQIEHSSEYSDAANLQAQINSLSTEIKKIKEHLRFEPSYESKETESYSVSVNYKSSAGSIKKFTPDECREAVHNYGKILHEISKNDCGISAVNQCANILWRWFNARIFGKYDNAPPFR